MERRARFGDTEDENTGLLFPLDSAPQGAVGLAKIREASQQGQPSMIALIDIRMPLGLDGIETIKQIGSRFPNLEVVICSELAGARSPSASKTLLVPI